jgi:hypothetical protein
MMAVDDAEPSGEKPKQQDKEDRHQRHHDCIGRHGFGLS